MSGILFFIFASCEPLKLPNPVKEWVWFVRFRILTRNTVQYTAKLLFNQSLRCIVNTWWQDSDGVVTVVNCLQHSDYTAIGSSVTVLLVYNNGDYTWNNQGRLLAHKKQEVLLVSCFTYRRVTCLTYLSFLSKCKPNKACSDVTQFCQKHGSLEYAFTYPQNLKRFEPLVMQDRGFNERHSIKIDLSVSFYSRFKTFLNVKK